jgi:3-oxoacyl-[acyl-carrier-protein] synthase-3
MTVAIDTVTRLLKTNKRYKKGLVVGSVMMSAYGRKDDVSRVGFSDSASAVVLELVEENIERGFIDSVHLNSDIFQLEDAINRGIISEGSNVLMNGTGVGITTLMALYRL